MLALKDWQRDPDRAALLIAEIDRMAHVMRLLCAGTGKRVRRFSDIIDAIRSGEPVDASHPAFQLTREETRSIAFHLKDLHKRGPKICKLLLMRIGDVLDGRYNDCDPEIYTIEHVLPQRPSATSEWRRLFPTSEDRSECIESLGNLVLISQAQNDRARNASFDAKKAIYADTIGSAPLLPITAEVLTIARWSRDDIEAREAKLLTMIAELLRIEVPLPKSVPQPSEGLVTEQLAARVLRG
nr:HNH endonuclease family protein [Hyphomicrobium sp.]